MKASLTEIFNQEPTQWRQSIDTIRSTISLSVDTVFTSFSASFLIEAVGCVELGGALIAPAGWQRWAIEPLCEPSIHQSGKMLNPPDPSCSFLMSFCLFHPLLKLTHTHKALVHSIFSPLLPWITHSLCLGAKILSYSFRDSIGGLCNGIHHYTDGSSFPSPAPSLWMGND